MLFTLNFSLKIKQIKKRLFPQFIFFVFVLGSTFLSPKTYAVVSDMLYEEELPIFSCAVIFTKEDKVTSLCSGDVISENRLLTAARCVEEELPAFILCPDKQGYKVIDTQIAPNYLQNDHSDHALLQIDSSFTSIEPVQLPENHTQIDELLTKGSCRIFSYGLNAEGTEGNLLGINVEFNGADFGPGTVGLGSSSDLRPGDNGSGLICRIKDTDPYIRIGTVSKTETGFAKADLLSTESLEWLGDHIFAELCEKADFTCEKMAFIKEAQEEKLQFLRDTGLIHVRKRTWGEMWEIVKSAWPVAIAMTLRGRRVPKR